MKQTFEPWYWLNEHSKAFLQNGYLKGDEKEHFRKIADKAEKILGYSLPRLDQVIENLATEYLKNE